MFKSTLTVAALSVAALSAWAVSTANGAITLDLTGGGTAGATANIGGTFRIDWVDQQSTGTGVIDPFVRVQAPGNEGGYNTDIGTPLDTKGGIFTHALSLTDIPVVNLAGVDYRQFLLDINQVNSGASALLSLNQIQIFQSASDMLHTSLIAPTSTTAPVIGFSGASEVFRMNSTAFESEILLDYDLNPGSGAGDMFLYVRDAAFSAAGDFVIFYSQFGTPPGGSQSNDGFEEWAVLKADGGGGGQDPSVPEPATLLIWSLLGTLTLGMCHLRTRSRAA